MCTDLSFHLWSKICLDHLLQVPEIFEPGIWTLFVLGYYDIHGHTSRRHFHQCVSLPATGLLNMSETGSSNKLQLSPGSRPKGPGQAKPLHHPSTTSLGSIMSEFLTHTRTPVCQHSPLGLPQQSADIIIKGRTHWSSITCTRTRRVRTAFPSAC